MNEVLEMFKAPKWDFLATLVVQVLIISYILAWSWRRIVGTQAERLVKGVLVIAAVWGLSYLLHFTLIISLLHTFVPVALIGLVIIFQPELRRGLGHLGRMQTFRLDWSLADADKERTRRDVDQIIAAVRELSRSKTGALIVVEPSQGERDYISPGTTVNADISTTLLLTIFFPKSPLHDGAVVIRHEKIVAAGVILPMTDDPQLSYRYGTRHRAAIGLSETYDGLCIVVSEETGIISAASRGMLARYKDADDLREPIMYLYTQAGEGAVINPLNNFLSLFSRGKRENVEEDNDEDSESREEERVQALDQRASRLHSIDMVSRTERLRREDRSEAARAEGAHSESEITLRRKLSDSRVDLGERRREAGRRKLSESQPIINPISSGFERSGTANDTDTTDGEAPELVPELTKPRRDSMNAEREAMRKSRATRRFSDSGKLGDAGKSADVSKVSEGGKVGDKLSPENGDKLPTKTKRSESGKLSDSTKLSDSSKKTVEGTKLSDS